MKKNYFTKLIAPVFLAGALIAPYKCIAQPTNISPDGLRFLTRHEGFRTSDYNDAGGRPTIGYGHLIRLGENYTNITREYAENLLSNDVQRAVNEVRTGIRTNLTQNQFDALVSFTFNVGNRAFGESTLRRRINAGDINASEEFNRWVNAGGRRIQGLVNRRADERRLFLQRD